MAKFCDKCGAQLDDNATFCTSCGASLGAAPQGQPAPQAQGFGAQASAAANNFTQGVQNFTADLPRDFNGFKEGVQKKDKKVIGVLIGAVVVVVLIIVLLVNLIGGGGYKEPLDKLVKGFNKSDAKMVMEATMPSSVLKAYEDEEEPDWDELDEELEESKEDLEDEYGEGVTLSYKVTKATKLSDKKLKKYRSMAEYYSEATDGKKSDFYPTAGYKLDVTLTIEGDDDDDEQELEDIIVVKIDGDWVFSGSGLGSLGGLSSFL